MAPGNVSGGRTRGQPGVYSDEDRAGGLRARAGSGCASRRCSATRGHRVLRARTGVEALDARATRQPERRPERRHAAEARRLRALPSAQGGSGAAAHPGAAAFLPCRRTEVRGVRGRGRRRALHAARQQDRGPGQPDRRPAARLRHRAPTGARARAAREARAGPQAPAGSRAQARRARIRQRAAPRRGTRSARRRPSEQIQEARAGAERRVREACRTHGRRH